MLRVRSLFTPFSRVSIEDEILSSFSFTVSRFVEIVEFIFSNLLVVESLLILIVFVISSNFSRIVASTSLKESKDVSRR